MPVPLLFTIDVEEFTLPAEYGIPFDVERAYELGHEGLKNLASVLGRHAVTPTLFVTAAFARRFTATLLDLQDRGAEIGLHARDHTDDYQAMPKEEAHRLLGQAKNELVALLGKPVLGYRANCFRAPPRDVIRSLEFSWTSNLHPAWVPGAYNNSHRTRMIHDDGGVIEVPISATPRLRLPVSWFWMRNFGLWYTKTCCRGAMKGPGYLQIYVHPWETAELPRLKGLPLKGRLSARRTGAPFLRLIDRFLTWCDGRDMKSTTITRHLVTSGWMKAH